MPTTAPTSVTEAPIPRPSIGLASDVPSLSPSLSPPSESPTRRPAPESNPLPTRPAPLPTTTADRGGGGGGTASGGNGAPGSAPPPPVHLVYILADDVGFNDFGYQSTDLNSAKLPHGGATPVMDRLAHGGVILENFYAMPDCTPSRSALLSGVHPVHNGLFHLSIGISLPFGLPLHFRLLPEYLKQIRSDTVCHGVGKWDLGHFHKDFVPTSRGFDSWYGYYSSFTSYFSHIGDYASCREEECYTDFNLNGDPLLAEAGTYSTELFSARATKIISEHATEAPLFLYFTPTACHADVEAPVELIEARKETLDAVPNHARRIYAACLLGLDDAVAAIETALHARGLWEQTVLMVSSDNGAEPQQSGTSQSGSNWPLKGQKFYVYEGGTRVPAFIHSPLLPQARRGIRFSGLFHIADVVPTFVAGVLGARSVVERSETLSLDGGDSYDQWGAIVGLTAPPRSMILYNIDSCIGGQGTLGALRIGDWKLIVQETNETSWPVPTTNDPPEMFDTAFEGHMPAIPVQLYNVSADPREQHNLADAALEIVEWLNASLVDLMSGMADAVACSTPSDNLDYEAVWGNHNKTVGPWIEDPLFMYHCSATYRASQCGG